MDDVGGTVLNGNNAPKQVHYFSKVAIALAVVVAISALASPTVRSWFLENLSKSGILSLIKPSQTLFISLEENGSAYPYQFNFKEKTLTRTPDANGEGLLKASHSPDGRLVAYQCFIEEVQGVCVFDTKENVHIIVSKNSYTSKRDIRFAQNGKKIVYTARVASLATPANEFDPNLWGVFVAKVDGTGEERVATGTTPFFSPDGFSVFSLQTDGLHEMKLAEKKDLLVWPMEGRKANRFMTVRPSPNGKKLLWTSPLARVGEVGSLSLFEVISWRPFSMKFTDAISASALQAVFSPDSSAIVFNTRTDESGELYRYALEGEPEKILDLSAYGPGTYITDWK